MPIPHYKTIKPKTGMEKIVMSPEVCIIFIENYITICLILKNYFLVLKSKRPPSCSNFAQCNFDTRFLQ